MIHDAALPPGLPPPPTTVVDREGIFYTAARWDAGALTALVSTLRDRGRPALLQIATGELQRAWSETVETFLDPQSAERRMADPALTRFCRLPPSALQAALESVLGGARRGAARLFADARPAADERPVLVVLSSNLPALAVQPLLPALALRRPVVLKSPTAEPLFAPAFLRSLCRRLPDAAPALAGITWKGGDRALEVPLLAAAGRVLAYGDQPAIDDLTARAPGRVFGYGPRISLALVSAGVDPERIAPGLARDLALFDQRGCLSIHAIYTAGEPRRLADALGAELSALAQRWPPGAADPAAAAAVQQLRAEATMRGLYQPPLPPGAGNVIVEPLPELRPSPGLRTIRIHSLPSLDSAPPLLEPWRDRLQGAALAGAEAEALAPLLAQLGVSRTAEPGELQSPDALWHNGGLHPLEVLSR